MHFDVFFAEKELHERGELGASPRASSGGPGHVYDADGATWVRTSDFGDDKDRVYVRSNGEFTYFAADCAYYLDKRGRGFGKVVHHPRRGPPRLRRPACGPSPPASATTPTRRWRS